MYSFQEVNRSIPMHERNLTNELIVKIRIPQPFTLENRTYMPDFISSIKNTKSAFVYIYMYVCVCVSVILFSKSDSFSLFCVFIKK